MIDIPAGNLFLGEHLDPETRKRNGEPVLLEAADLTAHGVIVGMTGPGRRAWGSCSSRRRCWPGSRR